MLFVSLHSTSHSTVMYVECHCTSDILHLNKVSLTDFMISSCKLPKQNQPHYAMQPHRTKAGVGGWAGGL